MTVDGMLKFVIKGETTTASAILLAILVALGNWNNLLW
jgi:hypothetical protein